MSLLKVNNLKTHFFTPFGTVRAVDDISFEMESSVALGLAGESGCGKTTAAYSLMNLVPLPGRIVGGQINFKGKNIVEYNETQLRDIRWKEISMVFQGAMASLNPLYTIGDQISEPIIYHEDADKKEGWKRAEELLELVGIEAARVDNYPWELSGGMRQRAMIAMALACNPSLLIADEPTTALDVIVSAQVMDLIKNLRKKLDLSMLLITHDISVIAQTCDELAIMYAGKLVEKTDVPTIFKTPLHPYSNALIKAFPNIKGKKKKLSSIPGSPIDLIAPPLGCRFAPRCPFAQPLCLEDEPILDQIEKNHFVACHFWEDIQSKR
ncbi:MAG: ABC transporter ATP-binding protein [Candidatus Bathyarchaeota archaeon]|jgi:peptide/nickel transport system ATP-binding protein|nr:ABC transporter ATP-binding protein [Candidatus Bathyarchaeota archaeon]MDP7207414.1 ABC transporter ATP-binding protein [Candidatus Bathyarchaeota archaeon]